MTGKKAKKATTAKPSVRTKRTAAKKTSARKVIVVDKPSRGVTPTPIDRRTGKPHKAPKLVYKHTSRDDRAALDHVKIRGQ